MQQPRQREFGAAGAAADSVGGLDHGDGYAGLGESNGRRETVGPGADDDRVGHVVSSVGRAAAEGCVTVTAIDGSPSSQGWRRTMSTTLIRPFSTGAAGPRRRSGTPAMAGGWAAIPAG